MNRCVTGNLIFEDVLEMTTCLLCNMLLAKRRCLRGIHTLSLAYFLFLPKLHPFSIGRIYRHFSKCQLQVDLKIEE